MNKKYSDTNEVNFNVTMFGIIYYIKQTNIKEKKSKAFNFK